MNTQKQELRFRKSEDSALAAKRKPLPSGLMDM
jgi:hypothetical protein